MGDFHFICVTCRDNRFWGRSTCIFLPSLFSCFSLILFCCVSSLSVHFISVLLLLHSPLLDATCFLPLAFRLCRTCRQPASSLFLPSLPFLFPPPCVICPVLVIMHPPSPAGTLSLVKCWFVYVALCLGCTSCCEFGANNTKWNPNPVANRCFRFFLLVLREQTKMQLQTDGCICIILSATNKNDLHSFSTWIPQLKLQTWIFYHLGVQGVNWEFGRPTKFSSSQPYKK